MSPATPMGASHVVIVGSMAVGKSTVGRRLAARLSRPFRDSDDDLMANRGIIGRELAEREGVEALHRWEAEHLLRTLAGSQPTVVAAAASVADDAACRTALRGQFVVWLRAPAPVLARRMAGDAHGDDHRRRLGDGDGVDRPDGTVGAIERLATARADRFAAVADLAIDTVVDGITKSPDEIVTAVLAALPHDDEPPKALGED